jgi:hypothetical protein
MDFGVAIVITLGRPMKQPCYMQEKVSEVTRQRMTEQQCRVVYPTLSTSCARGREVRVG